MLVVRISIVQIVILCARWLPHVAQTAAQETQSLMHSPVTAARRQRLAIRFGGFQMQKASR